MYRETHRDIALYPVYWLCGGYYAIDFIGMFFVSDTIKVYTLIHFIL